MLKIPDDDLGAQVVVRVGNHAARECDAAGDAVNVAGVSDEKEPVVSETLHQGLRYLGSRGVGNRRCVRPEGEHNVRHRHAEAGPLSTQDAEALHELLSGTAGHSGREDRDLGPLSAGVVRGL